MTFDKVIVMVIAYWIFEIALRLGMYFEWDYFQLIKNDSDNEYLYIIFLAISDILAIFPKLYFYIKHKKEEIKERNNIRMNRENLTMTMIIHNNNIDEQSNKDVSNPTNRGLFTKLLCLAGIYFLDLLVRSNFFIYHSCFDTDNEEVSQKFAHDFLLLVDIIMRFIFYKIFYNLKFKRHHILSICIISIIFISLIIFDILNLNVTKKYILKICFIYIGVLTPRSILFPLIDTLCKKIMENKYIYPLTYMLCRGIGEIFYLSIITPILFNKSLLHITSDIFTKNFWLISSIYIVACSVKASLLIHIVYYYSSTFVSFLIMSEPIAGSIHGFIHNIMNNEKNLSVIFSMIEILFLVLIVIATLIYEGRIKLPCCGLNNDTDEEIQKRSEEDQLSAILPNEATDED